MLAEEKRKRVLRVMVILYAVFGLAIVYFFFFNTGLSLVPDPANQEGIVNIRNDSVHVIKDISISYLKQGQKIELQSISELYPRSQISIPLLPEYADEGWIVVQASAPYHLSQQIVIAARANEIPPKVLLTFSYPDFGFVDVPVESTIRACNQENFSVPLTVDMRLSDNEVSPNPPPQSWSVEPGECASVALSFTPTREAEDLSFNIRVLNESLVIVEQTHVMSILQVAQELESP